MQEKRTASARPIASNILNYDLFRHPFRFMLPNGYDSVKSNPGRIATLLLVIFTIAYGTINMIELSDYGKTTMRLDVVDYYYSDTDVFNIDKTPGLNIAFGVTHYDNNTEKLDDLDYGEVIGVRKFWDGQSGAGYARLDLRPCTREELGLDKPGEISETAKFYPAHSSSASFLEFYWKKLECYDDVVNVHGNYNSETINHLHFYFKRCDKKERSTCKSDEEFENFTRNLFYVHLQNSVRFSQTGYGEDKVKKESRFVWNRLNLNNVGDEVFYEIETKEIRM